LNKAVIAEDWASAENMITDDIMLRHAASGRRDQARARFAEYHAAGLDEVVIAGANSGQQISEVLGAALNLHGEPVR
jgi:5,10-methylenetetrahydromethanopterin reductase